MKQGILELNLYFHNTPKLLYCIQCIVIAGCLTVIFLFVCLNQVLRFSTITCSCRLGRLEGCSVGSQMEKIPLLGWWIDQIYSLYEKTLSLIMLVLAHHLNWIKLREFVISSLSGGLRDWEQITEHTKTNFLLIFFPPSSYIQCMTQSHNTPIFSSFQVQLYIMHDTTIPI